MNRIGDGLNVSVKGRVDDSKDCGFSSWLKWKKSFTGVETTERGLSRKAPYIYFDM